VKHCGRPDCPAEALLAACVHVERALFEGWLCGDEDWLSDPELQDGEPVKSIKLLRTVIARAESGR
jgi:hypothetical protein